MSIEATPIDVRGEFTVTLKVTGDAVAESGYAMVPFVVQTVDLVYRWTDERWELARAFCIGRRRLANGTPGRAHANRDYYGDDVPDWLAPHVERHRPLLAAVTPTNFAAQVRDSVRAARELHGIDPDEQPVSHVVVESEPRGG